MPRSPLIQKFENLFTSDKTSCKLLEEYNKQTHFVGDTRYDRVANNLETAREFADIVKFKSHKKLLIVGSSWEKEEALTKKLLDTSPNNLCVIIAPHDIQRTDQIIKEFKLYSPKRYTEGLAHLEPLVNPPGTVPYPDTRGPTTTPLPLAGWCGINLYKGK